MNSARATGQAPTSLTRGMMASVVVHGMLVALAIWWGGRPGPVRPPVYRVELVGQAGPRQAGVETPTTQPVAQAPDVAGAERVKEEKVVPTPSKAKKVLPSPKATPSPRARSRRANRGADRHQGTAAPKSGAGPGQQGADVANVRTDGIAFPFPGT